MCRTSIKIALLVFLQGFVSTAQTEPVWEKHAQLVCIQEHRLICTFGADYHNCENEKFFHLLRVDFDNNVVNESVFDEDMTIHAKTHKDYGKNVWASDVFLGGWGVITFTQDKHLPKTSKEFYASHVSGKRDEMGSLIISSGYTCHAGK